MFDLTTRQQIIVNRLRQNPASTGELRDVLAYQSITISEDSLVRDIDELRRGEYVMSSGQGPARKHSLTPRGQLLLPLSADTLHDYLHESRQPIAYNPDWLTILYAEDFYSTAEKAELSALLQFYQNFMADASPAIRDRWYQKWLIEFAWKSSAIEGNTYDVLETETLLIDHLEAAGKQHSEAVMIVNHQTAIRFVSDHKLLFVAPNLEAAEKVHALLVESLGVAQGLREKPVGISGSVYRPISNAAQLRPEFIRALQLTSTMQDVWSQTIAIILAVSYLQPFEDGNKRTARVLANGILYASGAIPLVLGEVSPTAYRRACLAFYELGSAYLMKEIIMQSWRSTVDQLRGDTDRA